MPSTRKPTSEVTFLNNAIQKDHLPECACCARPGPGTQTLEELDFVRSACAAAQQGNVDKLDRLLKRRPDELNGDGTQGGSGYTPLHYAAREGHLQAVQLLLDKGANVNQATRSGGATALHRAAYMGHANVVKTLVEHGADGSLQDADGETALHKAAAQGHESIMQQLGAKYPAALALRDRNNLTPEERLMSRDCG